MADLSKKLAVEGLDSTSYKADVVRQRTKIAGRTVTNNYEKGLVRQYTEINEMRDIIEDTLRQVNTFKAIDGTDTDKFTATTKGQIQKKLRNMCLMTYQNKAYLKVAEDFGFDAADEFKEEESDDISADGEINVCVEKIAKKYESKGKKGTKAKKRLKVQGEQR